MTIIHAARHGGINPAWLGEKMWPETTGSGSSGSRGHIGDTGRNLSAGAFLSRLRKAGLLYQDSPNGVTKMYTLSPAGRKALATHTGQEVRLRRPRPVHRQPITSEEAHQPQPRDNAMTTTIDLPTLVTIAQQIGATDLHLDTSRPPRARIDGHLHDLDGYDTPTNLQAALNQVAPGPTDTGRGNADDFIFTVGNQTCRTATWNENGNLGAMIRLLPAKGTPADLAHRAHTAKSALLYEELKRNQNL